MSFLQNLQRKKASLKHTETLVTQADGTRYLDTHSSKVPQKSALGFIVDFSPDETPSLVIKNLFIGSQDCCAPEPIHQYQIKSVLSVGITAPNNLPNVNYNFLDCLDLPDTNLIPIIEKSNQIIEKSLANDENILVHCNAGVSRCSAVIIAYLIQKQKMNYEDAFQLVKNARQCIQPNSGFVRQLKKL